MIDPTLKAELLADKDPEHYFRRLHGLSQEVVSDYADDAECLDYFSAMKKAHLDVLRRIGKENDPSSEEANNG